MAKAKGKRAINPATKAAIKAPGKPKAPAKVAAKPKAVTKAKPVKAPAAKVLPKPKAPAPKAPTKAPAAKPKQPAPVPETKKRPAARSRKPPALEEPTGTIATPWKKTGAVPDVLDLEKTPITEEEIAEQLARRDETLRRLAEGGRLSADERALRRARERERHERQRLAGLERAGRHEEKQRTRRALAKALRDQGLLDVAAAVDPSYAEKLERGRVAIERPDDEWCDCPDRVVEIPEHAKDGRVLRRVRKVLPRHRYLKRVPSARHGGFVPLVECGVCGHLNATPKLPPLLALERAAQEQAAAGKPLHAIDVYPDAPKDEG